MSSETRDKKRVSISLNPELYRRAKALGLNVSGVSERALRVYLDRLDNGGGQGDAVLASNGNAESTEDDRSEPGATTDEVDEHEAVLR